MLKTHEEILLYFTSPGKMAWRSPQATGSEPRTWSSATASHAGIVLPRPRSAQTEVARWVACRGPSGSMCWYLWSSLQHRRRTLFQEVVKLPPGCNLDLPVSVSNSSRRVWEPVIRSIASSAQRRAYTAMNGRWGWVRFYKKREFRQVWQEGIWAESLCGQTPREGTSRAVQRSHRRPWHPDTSE